MNEIGNNSGFTNRAMNLALKYDKTSANTTKATKCMDDVVPAAVEARSTEQILESTVAIEGVPPTLSVKGRAMVFRGCETEGCSRTCTVVIQHIHTPLDVVVDPLSTGEVCFLQEASSVGQLHEMSSREYPPVY